MKNPCIEPYNIMPIIPYSWDQSFAIVESNKKSIVERGWYPYNRNLMTYPEIRASITKEEAENELLNTSKIVLPLQKRVEITDLTNSSPQVIDKRFAAKPIPDEKKQNNFSTGMAAFYLNQLVAEHDLNKARTRIIRQREDGKAVVEKLQEMKGITGGRLFNAGLS